MKPTGKLAIALLGLLISQVTLAKVEATLDRYRVALGDTLNLTVTVTEDDEDLGDINTGLIIQDFEILNQSTRSSTQVINGQRNHQRQLILNITPKRTGTLSIPALQSGASSSAPLVVEVGEPVDIDPGAETVLFEAELDRESVYVQGQLLLTLRLQQAVNLQQRSISELQLDDAFVLPLEQRSFQRNVGGRPWLVHEVRYAVFPEQSGTLSIPAQSFSAREGSRLRGRLVRLQTPAIEVQVLPRPASYPAGATWLPARDVSIEEQWSSDPQQLTEGGSVTRSLRLVAEGMQGAQLPPITIEPVAGIKFFPDQPDIADSEIASGKRGVRTDSAALVATRPGQFTLPEIRIPWWDIETEQLRYALLPARTIDVAPAVQVTSGSMAGPGAPVSTTVATPMVAAANSLWPWLAVFMGTGWAVTAGLWWRSRRGQLESTDEAPESPDLPRCYKSLLATCAAGSTSDARQWLLRWAAALEPALAGQSMQQVSNYFGHPELGSAIEEMNALLYRNQDNLQSWDGSKLATIVKQLHKDRKKSGAMARALPPLYPTESRATT